MKVMVKKNLNISPITWYHKIKGTCALLDVELESPDWYFVKNWKYFVSPYEIESENLSGLSIPKSHCIEPVYNLTTIDKNHLIFRAYGIAKPVHVFVVPDMTANSETTYIMDKIKSKPLKEVIQILLDSGFEIYTKFRAGEEV